MCKIKLVIIRNHMNFNTINITNINKKGVIETSTTNRIRNKFITFKYYSVCKK